MILNDKPQDYFLPSSAIDHGRIKLFLRPRIALHFNWLDLFFIKVNAGDLTGKTLDKSRK